MFIILKRCRAFCDHKAICINLRVAQLKKKPRKTIFKKFLNWAKFLKSVHDVFKEYKNYFFHGNLDSTLIHFFIMVVYEPSRWLWINLKRYGILSEQIVQFNPQYDLNDKSLKFILINYIKIYIQTS